jgi:hypothetical protein
MPDSRFLQKLTMAVLKEHQADVEALLAKRRTNGAHFGATPDGRWRTGSPFSTFDCVLLLTELGLKRSDPVLKGEAWVLFGTSREDVRFRPAPKSAMYPCSHGEFRARPLSPGREMLSPDTREHRRMRAIALPHSSL